ncbi:uncharacterized protein KY384_005181 [Bacidia gigantensis]|uniref:uncharacterized protein n=1 Tax=Bacidia gigantensis TaxID=2732470 RepID=UPI001D05462F|nr:uncharacterized protein KY384_005181 [Bacidia gigantensis]KAG8529700.1 hypothetical protein KY384_005181 [Bacidia gigantensis]
MTDTGDLFDSVPGTTFSEEPQDFWPHILIHPLTEGTSEKVGHAMDRDWIDLERVLNWVRSCDATHDKCHRPFVSLHEPTNGQGMYFVSVSKGCLVEAKFGEKYVALSYVWGTISGVFKCTKANISSLRSIGSLCENNAHQYLPATIQRAMKFTLQLGFDLLWVDCLCIVQDDPVHAAAQINNMASIYSNACLTLCAADGLDANSGLRGVPGCSQPRSIQQDILGFADGPVTSNWIVPMHKMSVYEERGWTFQEKILSRRVIAFTEHGLEWTCQEALAEEQHHHIEKVSSTYVDHNIARETASWPCLKKWDNLLRAYLRRKLTYEEDILRAFGGISTALAGSMSEGFLFGLPQQFFDAALLWVPTEYLKRRKDTRNGVPSAFPSWSWAGWNGAIENQINAFGLGHERSNPKRAYKARQRDIFPQVSWYKTKFEMGQPTLVKIPNDYAKYQSEGLQGSLVLPLGWSSHRNEDDNPFYYKYDKAPSSQTFWYPIPANRSPQPVSTACWSSSIFFKSLRSYLILGSVLPQKAKDGDGKYPLHSLETKEGEWAGVIYVHYDPGGAKAKEISCELVLISGGFASENDEEQSGWIPEWNFERRPRSKYIYYFYHCLWIERQGKLSYRRGLARVARKMWNTLSKDHVSILLA